MVKFFVFSNGIIGRKLIEKNKSEKKSGVFAARPATVCPYIIGVGLFFLAKTT